MSLDDAKVLVTRPQGQADGLLAAIKREGAEAWHYPVMAIKELDRLTAKEQIEHCKQQILQLDHFQHVIFISGNAVRFGMEWINQYWPQLPVGIHWYGIGSKTITELLTAGVPVNSTGIAQQGLKKQGPMNSEALLALAPLQQLAQQKVLIIRGIGGRETLQQQLRQRGASVSYAECYQRTLVDKPEGELATFIELQGINSVCVNSGESLHNLCHLAGKDGLAAIKQALLVVPGARVAAIAQQLGFERLAIADNASDEAMVVAINRHWINK